MVSPVLPDDSPFIILPFSFRYAALAARQAEAARGDHVAVDLARAGGDRARDAGEILAAEATLERRERPLAVNVAVHAEQLHPGRGAENYP